MPEFDSLEDAQRIIQEAWDSFQDHGSFDSDIEGQEALVTWGFRGGTMDAGTAEHWEFTGDQRALTDWWRSFGPGYYVLPRQWKGPAQGYQINLMYTVHGETWFNYHLSVP